MERSADHSTTEPATDGTDGDQTETAPDRTDTGAELAQLEDRWRRALADLDNLRKRYAKDLDRERAAETARVSAAWLPVLDNLALAVQRIRDAARGIASDIKPDKPADNDGPRQMARAAVDEVLENAGPKTDQGHQA